MIIEKEPLSTIAGFAITDDPAVYELDETQLDFFTATPAPREEDEADEY